MTPEPNQPRQCPASARLQPPGQHQPAEQQSGQPGLPGPAGHEAVSTRSRITGCLLGGAAGDAYSAEHLTPGALTALTQLSLYTADGLTDFLQWAADGVAADPTACVWLAYLRWYRGQGEPVAGDAPPAVPRWIDAQPAARDRRNPDRSTLRALSRGQMNTRHSSGVAEANSAEPLCRVAAVGLLPYYRANEIYRIGLDVAALTDAAPVTWHSAAVLTVVLHELVRSDSTLPGAVTRAIEIARDAGAPAQLVDVLLAPEHIAAPDDSVLPAFLLSTAFRLAEHAAKRAAGSGCEPFPAGLELAAAEVPPARAVAAYTPALCAVTGSVLGAMYGSEALSDDLGPGERALVTQVAANFDDVEVR